MKLDPAAIEWAIKSLDKHGDTDLFPKPVELKALAADLATSVKEVGNLDISQHQPGAPRRFIVPKDDLSYRAATQLDPLDSVILTAMMKQFGAGIEARRISAADKMVFSYRFGPTADFEMYKSRGAWNDFWQHCLKLCQQHKYVLYVDIADFYNQIYHHTIENQLIESGLPNQASKWILRVLENVSAKVSRGVPVGPFPAHLLAEATLIPVDNSLTSRGITFARFVDDIVIFTNDEMTARTCHYQVAEILDKQQRLHLQKGKTQIVPAAEYAAHCGKMIEDRPINELEKQLLAIIQKYAKGDPYKTISITAVSKEDYKSISPEAVEKILGDYLASALPDYVRLRWFLRRLAQVGHPAGIEFCIKNFDRLVPAVSDVCHYFASVGAGGAKIDWLRIGDGLISLLDNALIQSNNYFQISILSLFSRERQLDHTARLLERFHSSSHYLRRKIILAAEAAGMADWLRELKEEVKSMDPWTRRAYLYSAHLLPSEERKFFLKFVESDSLLDKVIVGWAKK
ncbi:MAG: RNA-directed DNA polymerase [Planctomycetaceae bacterium]|nr:RNA-directed DNA polymerase [Planctomycetaceae bacterium]